MVADNDFLSEKLGHYMQTLARSVPNDSSLEQFWQRRRSDEQGLIRLVRHVMSVNSKLVGKIKAVNDQNTDLKSYLPVLLQKIDLLTQDSERTKE